MTQNTGFKLFSAPLAIAGGLLALALALPGPAAAQERQPVDSIVALVDEDVILRSELDAAIDNVTAQVSARGERLPPRPVLEEQVLERLVMTRVELQRARQTGIRVSDLEVDRALGDVARQNNMTLSQLRDAIERDGFDFNEFREDIRQELTTSRLRQRIVDSMDEVTDTEVDLLLASDRFGGDEYHLSQILITVPQAASPAEVREAEERAADVYRRLQEGLDFASAAISYSQAPDALDGGQVGWRNVNTLPRQFADAVEDLQPGQISEPLRVGGGILIVRVNERRPRGEVIVRELNARHLMIEQSELVSADDARRRIEDLYRRLTQGEAEFGALAREWSDDNQTANIGGSMGWFPAGAFGPMFQEVLDNLRPGEVSQPFQSATAWHLLKLEDTREADRTEESMRAEARELILRQKADEEVERMLRQFRDEAYVDIRL